MKNQLQSLELWRSALVSSVRGEAPDLSARQMALLLCVYLGADAPTVRGLAKELKISKPAVSRALDRLGELGYIRRERDDLDRRNVLVQKTQGGIQFLKEFAGLIEEASKAVESLSPDRTLDAAFESLSSTASAAAACDTPAEAPAREWADAAA